MDSTQGTYSALEVLEILRLGSLKSSTTKKQGGNHPNLHNGFNLEGRLGLALLRAGGQPQHCAAGAAVAIAGTAITALHHQLGELAHRKAPGEATMQG